jgi:hypothetical protein|tara:strand:- start:318 stop:548 length:231 start_codon:yes stop_codon:yes gene_type:complete
MLNAPGPHNWNCTFDAPAGTVHAQLQPHPNLSEAFHTHKHPVGLGIKGIKLQLAGFAGSSDSPASAAANPVSWVVV